MSSEASRVPSDLDQFATGLRHQFRFYLRTRRVYGLLGFVLLVVVAFVAVSIVKDNPGTSATAYLSNSLAFVALFGVLIGAFIGGDAIAMDFGTSTGYFMLVLPVRRRILLLARYVAALAVSVGLLAVFYGVILIGTTWFYGIAGVPWMLVAESFALAAVYAAAVLSVAFFFSSFFRSPAMSMITAVLVLFLGFDFADGIAQLAGIEPWFSILYAGQVIGEVFTPLPHTVVQHIAVRPRTIVTVTTYNPYLGEGLGIMLAYIVIFLAISIWIYERKESKG